jgi:hypothetical protein
LLLFIAPGGVSLLWPVDYVFLTYDLLKLWHLVIS